MLSASLQRRSVHDVPQHFYMQGSGADTDHAVGRYGENLKRSVAEAEARRLSGHTVGAYRNTWFKVNPDVARQKLPAGNSITGCHVSAVTENEPTRG
jgi:hypothetical protein